MSTQYDTFAASYTKLLSMPPEQIEHGTTEKTIKPLLPNAKVLDLACGIGNWSRRMIDMGAAHVVAVDISAGMIESARAHSREDAYKDKIDYVVGDCQKVRDYGGGGGAFDMVLACWLLNYAPDKQVLVETFANAAANLRKGGVFAGSTVLPTEDPSRFLKELHKVRPKERGIIYTEETGQVGDGIRVHVTAWTEEKEEDNDVQFDCFHLRESVFQEAAREAGFQGGVEWQPLVLAEELRGRGGEEWLRGFVETPECGIFVARKA